MLPVRSQLAGQIANGTLAGDRAGFVQGLAGCIDHPATDLASQAEMVSSFDGLFQIDLGQAFASRLDDTSDAFIHVGYPPLSPAAMDFDDVTNGLDPAHDPVKLILARHLDRHDQRSRHIFHRSQLTGQDRHFFLCDGIGHISQQMAPVPGNNFELDLVGRVATILGPGDIDQA